MIELRLPYPPTVNHYYQRNRWGGVVLGPAGKQFRTEAIACTFEQNVPRGTMRGKRLSVTMIVHPPDRRRRDLDNVCKAGLDALHHADVIGDDSDIDSLHIERGDVRPGGEVFVTIGEKQ